VLKEELKMLTIAMGDSYNDTNMLAEAHQGILFCPPQNVIDEFPTFPWPGTTRTRSSTSRTAREGAGGVDPENGCHYTSFFNSRKLGNDDRDLLFQILQVNNGCP
jgi:hypothetical protein